MKRACISQAAIGVCALAALVGDVRVAKPKVSLVTAAGHRRVTAA